MAISKDFLWSTISQLTDELERVDPSSTMAARCRGFLDARSMGLHSTDRHGPKRAYANPQEDARIAELYVSGKSIEEVAIETGHAEETVKRALQRVGVPARRGAAKFRVPLAKRDEADQGRIERIREALAAGKTMATIGHEEGVTRERIRQICKRFGIDTAKQPTSEERAAIDAYLAGASLIEAAERGAIHKDTLKRLLRRAGHALRKERRHAPATLERAAKAAELYADGTSTAEIAEHLSIPQPTIYRLLAIAGVTPNRFPRPAETQVAA